MEHEGRAIRGVRLALLSNIAGVVLQTLIMAVLARLVTAVDYGLLAGALVVMRLAQHLLSSGPERAVLLLSEPSSQLLSAAFWALTATGTAGALLIAAGAGLAAVAGVDASYAATVAALTPLLPLTTAAVVLRVALRRHFAFGRLGLADIGAQLIGGGLVAVAVIAGAPGVTALVVGQLATSLLQTMLYAAFALGGGYVSLSRLPAQWWPLLRPMLTASLSISRTSFLEVLHSQLPAALIGALLGRSPLGLYNRATALVQVPIEVVVTAVTRVRIGTIVLLREDKAALRAACHELIEVVGALALPLCCGVAVAAPVLTVTVLGSDWLAAVPAVRWTVAFVTFSILLHVVGTINEGLLQFDARFRIQLLAIVASAAGLMVGSLAGGLAGALAGLTASWAFFLVLHLRLAARCLEISVSAMLVRLLPGTAAGIACAFAAQAGMLLMDDQPPAMQLATVIVLCAIATIGVYAICFPLLWARLLRYLGRGKT